MINMKKRGLGRGLDFMLDTKTTEPVTPEKAPTTNNKIEGELRQLAVTAITRGKYQPRQVISNEALAELADSIRAQGVIQPIVVRPIDNNLYEIIAGERRWRAAQLAGLQEIPAIIRYVPDEAAIAMALIENIQRENLNPIEEAAALHRLLMEFSMTHQQVADAVGKSRPAITNLMRLLELMPEVKSMVEQGKLSQGHAKLLLSVAGHVQIQVAHTIVTKNLSVRETEKLLQKMQAAKTHPAVKSVDPDVQKLEQQLSDKLGTDISINHNKKGHGKLVVHYYSLDQLEGILAHLR